MSIAKRYLSKVLQRVSSYKDFVSALFQTILNFDHTDSEFSSLYLERKCILKNFAKETEEICEYCKLVSAKGKSGLFYLTDNTNLEKQTVIGLLGRYASELNANDINSILKVVYPDLYSYMGEYNFEHPLLKGYFQAYKYQKLFNHISSDFAKVVEEQAVKREYISFGGHEGSADAGIILLGNIMQENMDEYKNMFVDLPTVFKESALLDRFHGFIRGWDIPRMHDDLKISGWALNSEYFCTMLHLLREDASYRAIVDQILEVPERADTRDTEAIKRIATGYLKLLFPHVRSPKDINSLEFTKYCLRPATKMRQIIKMQLGILDTEYKGKDVPTLTVRSEYGN